MPRVGVVGALVWDEIHGRDPLTPPVEEWGGIAYALAGFDAALGEGWEIVPLIKVGRDMSREAQRFLDSLRRRAPGARCIEVPTPNNRVVLHYEASERRCERMAGGVPGWTWEELGPMVRDLDALYVNFISGFELCLGTATALRQGFSGPIYADLHSLFLGMQQDGIRVLRPLPRAPAWFACFDAVQINEDEMRQLSPEPLGLAADAMGADLSLLVVTLGPRGAAYVAAPGFHALADRPRHPAPARRAGGPGGGGGSGIAIRTALVPVEPVTDGDPTGCGDVFGATLFARLLAGDAVEAALAESTRLARRNATYRGATGLARHLRGELVEA